MWIILFRSWCYENEIFWMNEYQLDFLNEFKIDFHHWNSCETNKEWLWKHKVIDFTLEEEISFISSLCWSYPQCFCQLLYEKTLRNQLFFGLKVNANDFSLKPMTLIRVLQPHHEPACVRLYLFSDIIVKKDFKVAEKRKCKHFHTHVSVCWQMVLYCDSTRFI